MLIKYVHVIDTVEIFKGLRLKLLFSYLPGSSLRALSYIKLTVLLGACFLYSKYLSHDLTEYGLRRISSSNGKSSSSWLKYVYEILNSIVLCTLQRFVLIYFKKLTHDVSNLCNFYG